MLFNKYSLIDANIGSTVQDLDKHLEKTYDFLKQGMKEAAAVEITNLRQCFNFIEQGANINYLSFAVMVDKINGVEYNDYSEEGLKKVIAQLDKTNFTYALLVEKLQALKKKLKARFRSIFRPTLMSSKS
jgi:hypothetical protein